MSLRDRSHPRPRALPLLAATAMVLVVAVGCSDDGSTVRSASGSASGSAAGSGPAACDAVGDIDKADTKVAVALDEWSVKAVPATAPAGSIGFDITNKGSEPHEMVVVKGTQASLPVDGEGALDEAKLPKGALIGEVGAFPAGDTCTGVFDLTPGTYSLLCNLVETKDGKTEAHLQMGMITPFTVT